MMKIHRSFRGTISDQMVSELVEGCEIGGFRSYRGTALTSRCASCWRNRGSEKLPTVPSSSDEFVKILGRTRGEIL